MKFGLTEAQEKILTSILRKHLVKGVVFVYGSRAKGTYSERSDVDLVIKGSDEYDTQITENIRDDISESDFPYLVDIMFFENLKNPALREHINRAGKVFCNIGG